MIDLDYDFRTAIKYSGQVNQKHADWHSSHAVKVNRVQYIGTFTTEYFAGADCFVVKAKQISVSALRGFRYITYVRNRRLVFIFSGGRGNDK